MKKLREYDNPSETMILVLTKEQAFHLEALLCILSDPDNINSCKPDMREVISDDASYIRDYMFGNHEAYEH